MERVKTSHKKLFSNFIAWEDRRQIYPLTTTTVWSLFPPNLCKNNVVDLHTDYFDLEESNCKIPHGMRIVNNSKHNLYVKMYIFDLADLSIGEYFSQNLKDSDSNLTVL